MSNLLAESEVEQATLDILSELGYEILYGPYISPEGTSPQRKNWSDVILLERIAVEVDRLNPNIPREAREEAVKKAMRVTSPHLIINNQNFHKMLTDGIDIEYRRKDGGIAGGKVRLVDFEKPENNDWLAVNQFTVIEDKENRRADVVLFVNGLPLAVI